MFTLLNWNGASLGLVKFLETSKGFTGFLEAFWKHERKFGKYMSTSIHTYLPPTQLPIVSQSPIQPPNHPPTYPLTLPPSNQPILYVPFCLSKCIHTYQWKIKHILCLLFCSMMVALHILQQFFVHTENKCYGPNPHVMCYHNIQTTIKQLLYQSKLKMNLLWRTYQKKMEEWPKIMWR